MNKSILIGICGASGSGKTALAQNIQNHLGRDKVVIIHEDAYYKNLAQIPLHERSLRNFDHPDAFDHPLMKNQVRDLLAGQTIAQPVYDYRTHTRSSASRSIAPAAAIILEGILVMCEDELRQMMDIRVFMDVPADTCFIRRLQRDIQERGRSVESVIDQYLHTVRPMYEQFVAPVRRYADVVVAEGGNNQAGIDAVAGKIMELLGKGKS
jgi:uridine kinase